MTLFGAVIFDLGGVVLDSPMDVLARYEIEAGCPAGIINRVVAETGDTGAWSLHETGKLNRGRFIERFGQELADVGCLLNVAPFLSDIEVWAKPRPVAVAKVQQIKGTGRKVAALTNNWPSPDAGWNDNPFHGLFDLFVESYREGVRKPDPEIYLRAVERLAIEPSDCVMLDDIGRNLKTAAELGMATIKVNSIDDALRELDALLGLDQRSPKA